MPLTLTLNDVADRLAASGLLSVGEIAESLGEHPETPQQLVGLLVQRGLLTDYQAGCILDGRIDHLLLGNYVVLDKLGQGGMGLVLKARHRRMDRLVAIKLLSPDAVRTPLTAERFQREVHAAAKLSHPNIVTAFDADEHGGTHFLVMEYVEGRDLSSIVKDRGPLSVPAAIDCILQAACGLEYAHQQGIIHRDIKPGNLILTAGQPASGPGSHPSPGLSDWQAQNQPHVKVLDMGLARIESAPGAAADHDLTTTGSILGTIDYMPPEQALDTKQADARSDIYSLGCSLFYLLIGHPPYQGDTVMRRLLAHRDMPIPDLSGVRGDVSPELKSVFHKMVAKKPDDRFQTMNEVLRALQAIRSTLGHAATLDFPSPRPAGAPAADSATNRLSGAAPPQSMKSGDPYATVVLPPESEAFQAPVKIPEDKHSSQPRFAAAAVGALLLIGAAIWSYRGSIPPQTMSQGHELVEKPVQNRVKQPAAPKPDRIRPALAPVLKKTAGEQIVNKGREEKKPAEIEPDPDRRAAEWIFAMHGLVHVDGQSRDFTTMADLPKEKFKITYVHVEAGASGGAFRGDASLKNLLGLNSLRRFYLLDNHRVTDAGIAQLKDLASLQNLALHHTRMTDDGLKNFAAFKRLESLFLVGSQFTDAGVAHLQECTTLRTLTLRDTQLSDKGLQQIQGLLAGLIGLGIENSKVTDAGLAHVARLQLLEQLSLNANPISDDGLKELSGLTNLGVLNLARTPITDAGLVHLRGLTKLVELSLSETKVTKEGVDSLQIALPKCMIHY